MNVFEDLVVELKEENLLESTFIDHQGHLDDDRADDSVLASEQLDFAAAPEPLSSFSTPAWQPRVELGLDHNDDIPNHRTTVSEPAELIEETTAAVTLPVADPTAPAITIEQNDEPLEAPAAAAATDKTKADREFFKKRAAGEMSSLKLVDAVLSAVEREHLKVVPRTYDDLDAKKALHAFMQVAEDVSSDENKKAEFKLLHETELWCSALAARDKNISVGHLRVYCETCKPMLSSQAMLAMARFYRNLPYAEIVRGKFDFIITRLFSKPLDLDKRELLFGRDAMLGHVKTLYADWSSIPLYSTDDDDSNIMLTALSFEELAAEAEVAATFDDLIRSDFFGRLRMFKESIAELFFAPAVTVAAIECNVRIGNVYVDLINQARTNMDADSIHQRFAELDDQTVSEAAGRSLGLLDILRERSPAKPAPAAREVQPAADHHVETVHEFHHAIESHAHVEQKPVESAIARSVKRSIRSVNKLYVVFSVLLITVSIGIYIWANYYAAPVVSNAGVKTLSFEGTDLGDLVKVARLSGDTLYIVAQPPFDNMAKEKQSDALLRFYQAGNDRGWSKVNLMNDEGKTIGFASSGRLEIY